jgi:hypothetical protein
MMRGSGAKCSHLRHECVHDTTNALDEKVLCEMNFGTREPPPWRSENLGLNRSYRPGGSSLFCCAKRCFEGCRRRPPSQPRSGVIVKPGARAPGARCQRDTSPLPQSRGPRVSRSSILHGSLPSEPVTDRQSKHGLGVLDPSVVDHGEGLLPGHDHGLEPLIELEVRRTRLEVFAQE